ncbi:hypothetical protein Tco_0269372, partial [Tanacetum coccineum]
VVRDTTTAASLDAAQASGNIIKTQSTAMPNDPLFQEIGSGDRPRCQEAMRGVIVQTRSEKASKHSYDSPLPGGELVFFWSRRISPFSVQGKLVQGELVQGELLEGELIQGELVQGELIQGELIQCELVQGELLQGELIQGELIQCELVQVIFSHTNKVTMSTLAEFMILSGGDNRPPMLEKHLVAKDLWERVQLLMQGTSLTKQERECKLYDAFDKFAHIKGESLHQYYLRFTQLINDMNIYKMKLEQFQVNTKFLNSLPPERSKFVTDVKLVRDLHTTNFNQLHAYLEQHELYANEVRIMRERNQDPLALVANHQMTPSHFT